MSPLELLGGGHAERGGQHARRALHQRQAVVALVGAQVHDAVLAPGDLHAHDVDREADAVLEIRRARPHVGDVAELDHGSSSGQDHQELDDIC